MTAFLCARALGARERLRDPHAVRTSHPSSLDDAQLVVDALNIPSLTIEISAAVDGYLRFEPDADARRRGNVMARMRMVVLFDQSAKFDALPIGTGNKTERLLGLLHLACRRHAAGKSPRRSLQEPGLGARALSRRPGSIDRESSDGGSAGRPNRRSRSRDQLRARRRDPGAALARATPTHSSSSAGSLPEKSRWCAAVSMRRIGSATCQPPRC